MWAEWICGCRTNWSNLQQRLDTCDLPLEKNKEHPFFKKMITGDKKWIIYNNVKRKRSWGPRDSCPTVAIVGLYLKKVMLCIWWDIKRFIMTCFQRTIDAAKYREQLDCFREASVEALRIGQQEGRDFSLRQHPTTHISVHSQKTWVFLGCFAAPSV